MALKPCIAATANLNKDDVNAVLDAHKAYTGAGMPESKAAASAIDDVIATVEAERQEWLTLIDEQYPATAAAKPKKAPKEIKVSENTIFTDEAAEAALALLKSKRGQLGAGIDPEMMQAGITLAGNTIERGVRTFSAYSKAMIELLGEEFRPYIRSWYEAIRVYPGMEETAKEMSTPDEIDYLGKFTQLHNATDKANGEWGEITTVTTDKFTLRMPDGRFVRTGRSLAKDIREVSPTAGAEPAAVKPPAPKKESPIVKRIPGEENTEIHIIRLTGGGHGVQLKDLDANKYLPTSKQFRGEGSEQKAIKYAESLLPKKPSAKKPAKNQIQSLASTIADKITKKEKMTWRNLFALADEAFGGTQAEGKYTPKDAYDAMEMGLNLSILESKEFFDGAYGEHTPKVRAALNTVFKKMELLPTQSKRTEEQDRLQQYSTPHTHGVVASWVANLTRDDVVLEPSAGTGNLATHALNAGVQNENIHVNELSDRRAGLLSGLFDNVTKEDALHINAILPKSVKPTVVIMNPPFSANALMVGKKDQLLGAKHVEQALNRLQPGGRLVAILGRGMEMDRAKTKGWWDKIKNKHNVRANVQVSGKEYSKFGTSFDNQFVVIDKTGPTGENAIVTGRVESVADLLQKLSGIRNDRIPTREQAPAELQGKAPAGELEGKAGRTEDLFTPAGERSTGAKGKRPAEGRPGRGVSDGGTTRVGTGKGVAGVPVDQPGGRAGAVQDDVGRPAGDVGARDTELNKLEDESGVTIENATVEQVSIGDSSFEQYRSPVKIKGSKPHPTKLAESAAMSAVKAPAVTYSPKIDKEIIESGKLSDVQLETIVRAGQAHSQKSPDGTRRGYFVGDGTGVGKGAQIAGIIQDNIAHGRKKAVWISENQKLYKDAQRDTEWVGGDLDKLFNQSKIKGTIGATDGTIFTTYSTLKAQSKEIKDEAGTVVTPATRRMDQLVDWLGEDFDGVIAFDEAHNMANSLDTKGGRGTKKASAKALAGVELQNRLPNARVVYVSATGATEVENLGYADRLGLWGEGTAFSDKKTFISEIKSGGVAAMEVVAKDMKGMGVYASRSLSYDDVEYSTIEHELSDEQRGTYDQLAEAWQIVLANVNQALGETGAVTNSQSNGAAKSAAYSAFWGSHQRFFNQVLTGLQMPSVVTDIEQQLGDGNSAVLQIVNTNEAVQERRMAQAADAGLTLDEIDISPRDILMQYVNNGFPTNQFEEYTDEDGNVRSRPVMDSAGNHVQNPQAIEMREALLDRIGALQVPEGPLEQVFNYFGSDAVAEITGRKRRLVRDKAGKVTEEKLGDAQSTKDERAFMDGKKRILVFSDAGGTGRSYHASNLVKNKQKRIHYLVQPGWRADKAVQGTGRTHRTNQAVAPHYKLVTTDLKAQRRFISTIARRLDQLGALTKGQRDTTSQGMFSAEMNLESVYGDSALDVLINDIQAGRVEGITMADFIQQTGIELIDETTGSISETKMPDVPKFLNRLLSMKIADMDLMFDAFFSRLETAIQYAKEQGTYDSGMETVKADAIRKTDEQKVPTSETKYVQVELENPAVHVQFDGIPPGAKFATNKKSGKLYAFTDALSVTDARTGQIVSRMRRISPSGGDYVKLNEFNQKYSPSKKSNEQHLATWENDLSKLSPVKITKKHLITGELLPIWDRLPSRQPRIVRMITEDREVLLGREIKGGDIRDVLKNIGITVSVPQKTTAEWMQEVMNKGATITLANGWQVTKRKVSGEDRIEVVGAFYNDADVIVQQGGFKERIAFKTRVFLPWGNGEVFSRVLKNKPVTDVSYPGSASFSVSGRAGQGMPVAEIEKAIAPIMLKRFSGPAVEVVESVSALPKHIRALAGNRAVDGVYDPLTKTVYLVAGNIRSERQAKRVLDHESIGHYSMEEMLGDEFRTILDKVQQLKKSGDRTISELAAEIADRYGALDPDQESKEIIAVMAERGIRNGLMKRIYAAIRKFLRSIGINRIFTTTELEGIIARASNELGRAARVGRAARAGKPSYSYAGPMARTADITSMEIAIEMNEAGESMEDIRSETGWFIGMDDKWRFEISDKDMKINENVRAVPGRSGIPPHWKLGDLISHPKLFKAYPQFENIRVETALSGGSYNPYTNTITVARKNRADNLIHEIQHAIQQREGFARGSAVKMPDYMDMSESQQKSLTALYEMQLDAYKKGKTKAADEFADRRKDIYREEAMSRYTRSAGEIEARDSAMRRYMSDIERGKLPPYKGQGIAKKDAIVKFRERGVSLSIPENKEERLKQDAIDRQEAMNNDLNKGQYVDKVFRKAFQMVNADEWSKARYKRGVHYLTEARLPQSRDDGVMNWMNSIIQTARAGLIDRYGLEQDYINREFEAEADKRKIELQAMDILTMLDKRGVNDVNEAQVLQAVLTGEAIPDEAWAELAKPIRDSIDQMGQEARDLGLITPEAYERNKGSYLHRVYRGHEAQQTALGKWAAKAAGRRRKRIGGDELKGRGMNQEVTTNRILKHAPPDWWGRKLVRGKADKQLINHEFVILDLEKPAGQGTGELIEGGKQVKKRIAERVYWPADLAIPARFGAHTNKGTWQVRSVKGDKIILWRDFTKAERESMGEILDSRYTIAKTYMLMAHDLSTGRFLKDISGNENWSTRTEPEHWENPKGALSTYSTAEWIKVPETNVEGTKVKKWGALAGMYVRAEIWRDLNELDRMQTPTFWQKILTQWKLNKTARNPVVHMNNIMSNLIFMDMADIRWRDLSRGIRSYITKDEHYQDALSNGAFGASYIEHEIRREVLDPILQELMNQDGALRSGPVEGWMNSREWTAKMSVLGKIADVASKKVKDIDQKAISVYQLEDEIFRMATYMNRIQKGDSKQDASRISRDQFLNYDIRAPWVNAARRSFLPFIAYTYRAVPVIAKSLAERPWKIAKYATLAYVMNALAYMIDEGDEEEERRSLNERAQGRTWIGTPRLIRMPWSDENGNPVFLDIRRWIPAGDVFDMSQNQMPLPAWIQFGGPLMLAGEFALNKQAFTGKEIVNDKTDTPMDKASKYAGWAWRSWMPAHPLIPGSWYWDKIATAASGGRDVLGRDYDLPMAVLSSLGIKLAPQDVKLGFAYKGMEFDAIQRQLNSQYRLLENDRNRGMINADEYEKQSKRLKEKMKNLSERATETFNPQ